ncbi:MAG: hypothetical protein J6C52_10725 [Clostridia bacterium]|nr:hypothetical protein [Clostridia bacterium]
MKHVILSADGPSCVYAVPDMVADNLEACCMEFCTDWLKNAPEAAKYRVMRSGGVVYCYDERAFIEYLNLMFPDERSVLVEDLGWTAFEENLPEKYKHFPYFNF